MNRRKRRRDPHLDIFDPLEEAAVKNWIRMLLGVTIIVIIGGLLLFLNQPTGQHQTNEPGNGSTQAASQSPLVVADQGSVSTPEPTFTPQPNPSAYPAPPTPIPNRPVCEFHGQPPDSPTESILAQFVFSEPQVGLTNTGSINVAGWLPDSQRVLISRSIVSDVPGDESIETFNIQTGERVSYGISDGVSYIPPVWLPQIQAVAYRKYWPYEPGPVVKARIFVSSGESEPAEIIAEGAGSALALASDHELAYFDLARPDRLQLWDTKTKLSKSTEMDFSPWLTPEFLATYPRGPNSVWQPNGPQVFFEIPRLYGVFLLGDRTDGTVCEVPIHGRYVETSVYVMEAVWSPNGRYLAIIIGEEGVRWGRVTYHNLLILDTVSGEWNQPELGIWLIWDLAWDSSSRHLLVLSDQDTNEAVRQRLYLIDTFNDKARQILPDHLFGFGGSADLQMDWSKNGKTVALSCPLVEEGIISVDRLCLINVEIDPKSSE